MVMILTPNQGYKGIRVQIYEPLPLPLGTLPYWRPQHTPRTLLAQSITKSDGEFHCC